VLILCSNDDGISSPGLDVLRKRFSRWGQTMTVAPAFNQSTTGHALSLHKPLRMERLDTKTYTVNGTPADCVHMALHTILKKRPTFVMSGINQGANLGQDVYYSGTVAAAREAAVAGIPAFAVSLTLRPTGKKQKAVKEIKFEYQSGARAAERVVKMVFKALGDGNIEKGIRRWPKGLVVNINVPNVPYNQISGVRLARQGRQIYGGGALSRKDSRGQDYYWIGGTHRGHERVRDTDCQVVHENNIAVTPLEMDCTDHEFLDQYGSWFD